MVDIEKELRDLKLDEGDNSQLKDSEVPSELLTIELVKAPSCASPGPNEVIPEESKVLFSMASVISSMADNFSKLPLSDAASAFYAAPAHGLLGGIPISSSRRISNARMRCTVMSVGYPSMWPEGASTGRAEDL
uniref:Uncharacterized protein n=1 Tax=Arundo donax TaxID=35708 RepID=A0A0A8ZU16_ARUDO